MTSKDTDDSQDALINLIYRHLKDNGYEKAANVLRKHAPQVETEQVKESLSEIFKEWTSKRRRHKKAGKRQTDAQHSDACSSSGSSDGEVSPELGQKAPVHTDIRKTGSKKQKFESSEDLATGNTSDSDSSLDVEKWTKLVSQLSEADIAKMEALSNFVESPVSSPGKSPTKRKRQTKPKKETNSAKNGRSRAPAKKAIATADDISVQTEATKISSKKSKARKPAVDHQTNGLLVTSSSNEAADLSGSETIRTPKKAKSSNSLSEQVETSVAKKADLNSETSSCETPSKKGKRKKVERPSESTTVQTAPETTDNAVSDTKVRKNKKASKPAEADCDEGNLDTHLLSDQSETPSKKVKNKKSKSAESSDVNSPFHKNKHHEGNRLSEAEESETPSRKSKKAKNVMAEPAQLEKTHKMPEMDSSDETLLQSDPTKGSSKKRKSKASSNSLEVQLSEPEITKSPIKSRKSEATTGGDDDGDGDDGLGDEESSSQVLKTPSKKRKHKREEADDVSAQEEATPEPKKNKKEKRKNKEAEDAIEDLEQPPEEEEAPVTITTDPKKKKKKKEKERESEETLADDPPVLAAAEEEITHKKKRKSLKEKHLGSDEAPGFNGTEQ